MGKRGLCGMKQKTKTKNERVDAGCLHQISTESGMTQSAGEEGTMLPPQELFQNMELSDRNTANY